MLITIGVSGEVSYYSEIIVVPNFIARERERQRAIERWENEGGRFVDIDLKGAREQKRDAPTRSPDRGAKRLRKTVAKPFTNPISYFIRRRVWAP
jgi:hypothetical protein